MSPRALCALILTVAALALAMLGCGSAAGPRNQLAWVGSPQLFAPRDLPRDRIAIGRIQNTSTATLRLQAASIRVRDARGQVLQSSAGFTNSYAHGLFGAFQQPSPAPTRELVRLGKIAILDPGATSPVFAAWRLPPGTSEAVSIDYGSGRLSVAVAPRPATP